MLKMIYGFRPDGENGILNISILQCQFPETKLGEGHVMLHVVFHPFEIHSSFPEQHATLSRSVFMSS